MSKPNKRHGEKCKEYKLAGRREINKAIKQERHKKRMAMFAKRKEEGKAYEYEPNPYNTTNMEYAHNYIKQKREKLAFNSYKNSMPEFKRMARVFGRLNRVVFQEKEAERMEAIKKRKLKAKGKLKEDRGEDAV